MVDIHDVLAQLEGVRQIKPNQWEARCPCHEDDRASLSIKLCDDRRILMFCHACGKETTPAIAAALGLSMSDLMPDNEPPKPKRERLGKPEAEYSYFSEDGELLYQVLRYRTEHSKTFRPRHPDPENKGKWIYSMAGVDQVLYRLPQITKASDDKWINFVEGEKDVETLEKRCLTATTCSGGAKGWYRTDLSPLSGRRVALISDNDGPGRAYANGIAAKIYGQAKEVKVVYLGGLAEHEDISDWFAAGHGVDELDALIARTPDWTPEAGQASTREPQAGGDESQPAREFPYEARDGWMWHLKGIKDGIVPVPLANFTATIVGETVLDDGVEPRLVFDVEATLNGQTYQFRVLAHQFAIMNWPTDHLGSEAIVFAGQGRKDHARVAIQVLSCSVRRRRIYQHLGFRRIDGRLAFLHAGGAIGVEDVEVAPPESLRNFVLPEPPTGEDLRNAVRTALSLLDVARDAVTILLFAATVRAPLGSSDFGIHIAGPTGRFKTELAALCQQFYGPDLDSRHLPASWGSTSNSLETLAHAAADTLLVVDDFSPGGTARDVNAIHRQADRLFRAAGNQSGRGRLRSDCTMRPVRYPRCLILSTGEDLPAGHSLRARLVITEIAKGDVDVDRLTECQQHAAEGRYAAAMAGYLAWLAPQYEQVKARLADQVRHERDSLGGQHRRTPTSIANLLCGFNLFIDFALHVEAIEPAEAESLRDRARRALGEVADDQAGHMRAADPVERFLHLLNAAIASGRAHVAATDGARPETPGAWGWREHDVGVGLNAFTEWRPQGDRVGWVGPDGSEVLVEPTSAYRVAQSMAGPSGEGVPIAEATLLRRLKDRGLLVGCDPGRTTTKRMVDGRRRRVAIIPALSLSGEPGLAGHSGHDPTEGVENGDFESNSCPASMFDAPKSGAQSGAHGVPLNGPCPARCPASDADEPESGAQNVPLEAQKRGFAPDAPQAPVSGEERAVGFQADVPF